MLVVFGFSVIMHVACDDLLGVAHLISRGGGGSVFYWESDNLFVFI